MTGPDRPRPSVGALAGLPSLNPLPTAAERAAEVIRDNIFQGRFQPGTALPEASLAKALQISRNTVREAFRTLMGEHLLTYETHKGVAVRRIALPFSGIRAERSKVVIFDLADVACADLDKLLVNEVLTCTGEDGAPIKGCADLVATTTRASASFAY